MFCYYSCAHGFLVNGNTTANTNGGSALTDKHFNTLMDLYLEERKSRLQLELHVSQLQQKMQDMQFELTNMKQKVTNLN